MRSDSMQTVGQICSNEVFFPFFFLTHHLFIEFTSMFQPLGESAPAYSKSFNIYSIYSCVLVLKSAQEEAMSRLQLSARTDRCWMLFSQLITIVGWCSCSWGNQKKSNIYGMSCRNVKNTACIVWQGPSKVMAQIHQTTSLYRSLRM